MCGKVKARSDYFTKGRSIQSVCKPCSKIKSAEYRLANKEKVLQYQKTKYERHRLKIIERNKEYARLNKKEVKIRAKSIYNRDREKILAQKRVYNQANKDKLYALNGLARAAKRNACPTWVDRAEIKCFYDQARALSKETGIKHHVDHIIPLKSKIVCGLHVPQNLVVITATDNLRKGNRFDPT
jgi:hypothetical protein